MNKRKLVLRETVVFAGVVAVAQLNLAAGTTATAWDGTTNNWSTAIDWTAGPYPQNGSPANTLYDVTLDSGNVTLDVNPTIQQLNWSGGQILGPGHLQVNGALIFGGDQYAFLTGASLNTAPGQPVTIGTGGNVYLELSSGSTLTNAGNFVATNGAIYGDSSPGAAMNNSGAMTINTPNSIFFIGFLQFNNAGTVTVSGGTLDLQAPDDGLTTGSFSVAAGQMLQFDADYTLAAAASINGAGTVNFDSGAVTVNGTYNVSGPTIIANGATLNLNGPVLNLPSAAVAGSLNLGANTGSGILVRRFSSLALSSGADVTVAQASTHGNRTVLVASSLSLGGSPGAGQGTLDLANNDMIVQNAGTIGLSAMTHQLATGYAGGSWTGAGIQSSAAANDSTHLTAIGVLLNNNGSGAPIYSTFDGVSASAKDVLLKYTYFGDANLDGVVDGSDYSRVDVGFMNGLTGWSNGDFNYDGIVNGSDYTLIDNTFNMQGASLAANISGQALPTAIAAPSTSVPEPLAYNLLSVTSLALCRRRRSRPQRNKVEVP